MASKGIRAILFDLGDTILDFGRVSTTALFKQGARSSHAFLKTQDQPVENRYVYFWRNLASLQWRNLRSNLTGCDFNALDLLRRIGTRRGIRLTPSQWEHFAWLWYEPLAHTATLEPGLVTTLGALQDRGLKLGLLSNTFVHSSSLERHLRELGLLEFFQTRLYSYEFAFRKPHPEIFRIAAQRIGEVPSDCMYVGDRINKDILPALGVGMQAVLKAAYTNAGKPLPAGTWKIERLAELPGLIDRINAEASCPA